MSSFGLASQTENFCNFPLFLLANARMVPQIRPLPLLSASLPVYYSLIILLLDAIQSKVSKVSLNKARIKKVNQENIFSPLRKASRFYDKIHLM
jgi:hypothetical protein